MPYVQEEFHVRSILDSDTPAVSVIKATEITEDVKEEDYEVYLLYGRAGDQPDGEVLVQVYEERQKPKEPRTSSLYRLREFSHGAIPNDLRVFLKYTRYKPELIADLIMDCQP
jgi:hypothetical protein